MHWNFPKVNMVQLLLKVAKAGEVSFLKKGLKRETPI